MAGGRSTVGVETHAPGWLQLVTRLAGPEIGEAASRLAAVVPSEIQISEEDLRPHLMWIARATAGTVEAGDYAPGATLTLRRRLIDRMRADLVREWSVNPPAPDAMVAVLERLENAVQACEPAADQSLASELTDRGGLDLVVEIAHDMRSPLTSILFLSEILHRGQSGAFNEVQKRQIGIIYSAALGLVGMASDMIEMARGGNRLSSLQAVPFSVNEILHSVHDLVKPTADEKHLELSFNGIPSEYRIGYPVPLSRVLLNLTTNALKFTQDGCVEITARPVRDHRVEFSVRDTGPGISPASLETLYQPFRREPKRETGYYFSGTGLGLAICRRLVGAMGSELVVETQDRIGTRFSFEIDLPPASAL